jgi:hypothetical protein
MDATKRESVMDIGALFKQVSEIEIDYEGESFSVSYAPQKYTSRVHHEVLESQKVQDFVPLVKILAMMLISWDLTDNGKPVAITEDTLAGLPVNLLMMIVGEVMKDVASGKNAQASPTTSQRAA